MTNHWIDLKNADEGPEGFFAERLAGEGAPFKYPKVP
jgi:hypothetical protein